MITYDGGALMSQPLIRTVIACAESDRVPLRDCFAYTIPSPRS